MSRLERAIDATWLDLEGGRRERYLMFDETDVDGMEMARVTFSWFSCLQHTVWESRCVRAAVLCASG